MILQVSRIYISDSFDPLIGSSIGTMPFSIKLSSNIMIRDSKLAYLKQGIFARENIAKGKKQVIYNICSYYI